ncbi:MAG: hypothetical protein WCJ45_00370 [bacterium]
MVSKQKKTQESLVMLYDTIRYQLAKEQYANPAFQNIKGIASIIESDHKQYTAHAKAIQDEITAREDKEGHEIVKVEIRNMIEKKSKQQERLGKSKRKLSLALTILTLGIYRIFL